MLHIHNGDSSASVLKQSGLHGEHLVWREALISGPTPHGLSRHDWHLSRANHLADAYSVDIAQCLRELAQQEEHLRAFSDHEEVVLWFEHDLFCQTLLIYLLQWFAQVALGKTRLTLICVNAFPGRLNFRGLGELNPQQMSSLFETRHEVTRAELSLAQKAWEAYCSPNPQAIEKLLDGDTSALPFLRDALLRHLARFPSTRNGLGRVENRALELVNAGYGDFSSLFNQFGHTEPVYGFGDLQFWNDLKRISEASFPLLVVRGQDSAEVINSRDFAKTSFVLTEAGESVRSDRNDYVQMNGIDLWLGGVHLSDKEGVWRWSEEEQHLTHATN